MRTSRSLSIPTALFVLTLAAALLGACECGSIRTEIARGQLETSPASLDFGTAATGLPEERTVTLFNQGQVEVLISSVTVTGEAAAQFSAKVPQSLRVEAGGSLQLTVAYSPTAVGNHSARLFIESDASNAPELLVPLAGLAVAPDLCAKVTCKQPPAATCVDGATLRSYASQGTCSAGECSYPPADSPCATSEVCQVGACKWDDATLLSLGVSPGSLAFSPTQTTYAVSVPTGTASIALAAAVSQPARAVLRIDGTVTTSGATVTVPLTSAATSISVRVDAESGSSKTYTVVVTVASAPAHHTYLKASNTGTNDSFGTSVALSADGSTLAVGAVGEASAATGVGGNQADNSAPSSGAVYVFARSGTGWAQQAYLKASNAEAGDLFGFSLALSSDGSTLAVGANREASRSTGVGGNQSDNSAPSSGAVYVFTRAGATWTQQAYVKASNTEANDWFGYSLALSADGSTLAVGAPWEDSSATGVGGNQTDNSAADSGAVYLLTRAGTTWSQQAYFKASNTEANDWFGYSVALSADGNTLAVGANLEDSSATGIGGNQADNSASASGAAYVFTRSGAAWAQQAYLKASNTGVGDWFGFKVALGGDGNTLAVAATNESSSATGLGGNQADNSAAFSGAVYLFTRTGATWAQQAYVKASNTDAGDQFGYSLALSADGNTLAVGATREASSATGLGGKQADNSAPSSGAVYLFSRTGAAWTQQAYVKATNTDANDEFGWCLGLSSDGGTLAVGAHLEDSSATGVSGNQADNSATDSGAVYLFPR